MPNLKLEAKYRNDLSKGYTKKIRREGCATGNVYGHGDDSVAIEVNLEQLVSEVKKSESGLKSLIDLKISGAPKKADGVVLIKKLVRNPLSRKVIDIEFQRVHKGENVHVGVPIVFVGEAPGLKGGGIFEHTLDELQISTDATNIPSKIEVDISNLEAGHHISVADLTLPSGITLITELTANVCAVIIRRGMAQDEVATAEPTE